MTKNLLYVSIALFASYICCSAQNLGLVDSTVFDCTTAQPPPVNCGTDPNCLYPNPQNCSQFFQCNDALLAYRFECPLYQAGPPPVLLVFNAITKWCDYPENYNCVATPTPSPPENEEPVQTTEQTTEVPTVTETPEVGSTEAPTEVVPPVITEEAPELTTEDQTVEPTTDGGENPTTAQPSSELPGDESTAAPSETPTETPTEAPTESSPADVCSTLQALVELAANCPQPRACSFPNPDTCQGFIQCQRGSDTPPYAPIANPMPCAPDSNGQPLYWNDNTYTCESRADSTCPLFIALKSILFAKK